MNQNLPNISQLFDEAVSLEGTERAAFVAKACRGDAALQMRLEKLLEAHELSNQFLPTTAESPALTVRPDLVDVTEDVGAVIGRYKLLERIGEGGGGVVYVAEQSEPVRRRVALKILKLGMDTRSVIARFEAERQALAMMDHPNIARVFDAGATSTGRPYFVMELVKGIPITDYCSRNRLGVRDRLELFSTVCHAIQHAHQKGVIHRDIKPSNVLVVSHDGVSVPKVIDFGIAKAIEGRLTDRTVYTQLHQFIGTPAYMSPEQAQLTGLDVDTRSDIYSLGVLLYELLTGVTPFDVRKLASEGLDAIRRVICETEPVRPSTRLSMETAAGNPSATSEDLRRARISIAEDLDWIVMRCLEKDRTRRYESANGLAADIQRHLRNEPVLACPPSLSYRLRKAVRRNRGPILGAAAVVAALLVGLVVASMEAVRAHRAERLAESRLKESETARANAEAVSRFFARIFRRPIPELDGRSITVMEVLRESVPRIAGDKSISDESRSLIQIAMAQTFLQLDMAADAVPLLEQARSQRLAALGPEHPLSLEVGEYLGFNYRILGRLDDAIRLQEEVLAARIRQGGQTNADTLRSWDHLGMTWAAAGRFEEFRPRMESALREVQGKLGPDSLWVVKLRESLAGNRISGKDPEAGIRELEGVFEDYRRIFGLTEPNAVACGLALAEVYEKRRRFEDAIPLLRSILEARRKSGELNGYSAQQLMSRIASTYSHAEMPNEAVAIGEELLALGKRDYPPGSLMLLRSMIDLAQNYVGARRIPDALRMGEEALAAARAYHGPDHQETIRIQVFLAMTHSHFGDSSVADRMVTEVLQRHASRLKGSDSFARATRKELADILRRGGKGSEAAALVAADEEELRKAKGPEHPESLALALETALFRCLPQPTEGPAREYRALVQTARRVLGTNSPVFLQHARELSFALEGIGENEQVLSIREELLGIHRRMNSNSWATASAYADFGFALDKCGRGPEAIEAWKNALKLQPGLENAHYWLCRALAQAGRKEEALAEFESLNRTVRSPTMKADVQARIRALRNPDAGEGKSKDVAFVLKGTSLRELTDSLRPYVAAHPEDTDRAKHLAQLLLASGDEKGHAELCRAMLVHAAKTDEPLAHERAAKASLLSRNLAPDLVELAGQSARRTLVLTLPTHPDRAWFYLAIGMADVRSGRSESAESFLRSVTSNVSRPEARAIAHCFGAIHHLRAGRRAEGLAAIEVALRVQPEVPNFEKEPEVLRQPDRMAFQMALREARELAGSLTNSNAPAKPIGTSAP